jgi:hypothetical protein
MPTKQAAIVVIKKAPANFSAHGITKIKAISDAAMPTTLSNTV